jgi:hypothetical protein
MIVTAITSRQQTLFCDRESLQDWKVPMRTSNTQVRKFGSTVGKILMALVFVSMIGGITVAPAFGEYYNHGHRGYYRHGHYAYGQRVYQRRYYSEPVYAPPPVVYYPEPYQSPGISLVFPIHIR